MRIAGRVEVISPSALRRAAPRMRRFASSSAIFASAIFAALTSCAAPARADQSFRLGVQWEKLAEIIRTGGGSLLPEMGFKLSHDDDVKPDNLTVDSGRLVMTPRVSLLARDWSGTGVLVGRLSPTDQVRLSRSSRMLLARVRATGGPIVPFLQAGVGQWRIDTDLLPAFRPDVEIAGQPGAGLEVTLTPSIVVALETDYTILYREQHEPQMVCRPDLWGSMLAARGRF